MEKIIFWNVTGSILIKEKYTSIQFSCVASDIHEAINEAINYGVKDISSVYRIGTTLKEN